MSRQGKVLSEAQFSPDVFNYTFVYTAIILTITVIGIPLLPVFALFFWSWWKPQFNDFHSLKLTDRGLEVRSGVVFRSETFIPLDRITDITIAQDPLMRMFNVKKITVETAGQTHIAGTGNLVGVVDPEDFRAAVLEERDKTKPKTAAPALEETDGTEKILSEIRDVLKRIETQGGKKA